MKCVRIKAKYTSQDYRTNEDILSELKFNAVVKQIQNYRNKWVRMLGERTGTDCHTSLCNISHVGNEAKVDTSEDFLKVHWIETGHED
jgi:hypothetical protein